ncbi:ABC transporter ATP-binding protein [Acinetobacter sp. MD2]|nr:ABC transporter ATP-binding protein [Acinetobacter sp. MD2]MEB3766357.1 ABC transporter ATP-binding protein [Acinetobacter sp. MD2]
MLPRVAKQRLMIVGLGWVAVAGLEAVAYSVLAWSIVQHAAPTWVLMSAVAAILMTVLVTRAGFLTGVRLAGDLFAELGHALARAKLSWFNAEQRTKITQMAGRGIPGFMSIPAHQLQSLLHAPFLPIFLVVGIGVVAGLTTALVALVFILCSLLIQGIAQYALMCSDKKRSAVDFTAAQASLELIDHLELLQSAVGPERALQRVAQHWGEQEQTLARTNTAAAWASLVATFASVLPIAGMTFYLLITDIHNSGLILALLLLIGRAAAPLAELATAGLNVNDLLSAFKNFNQLTHPPELAQTLHPQQPINETLSVQNMSYAPRLNQLSFDIQKGSRVWVSGVSGSGKTTLLELLTRFDDPQAGLISLGGVPLDQMRYEDLVSKIAYVAQEPILFTGSLAENIRLAKPDASIAEIAFAAKQAELTTLIERNIDGIHQMVGQQGAALSGGERQRVAIARALLKGAEILILDEATSALDEITESKIVNTILALQVTVIFVTHRDAAMWQPTQTIHLA